MFRDLVLLETAAKIGRRRAAPCQAILQLDQHSVPLYPHFVCLDIIGRERL